jgi:xanthine dehydrogenase/oxidase
MIERIDDMTISGTRHPFLFDYKIALDTDGRFLDLNVNCYNNAGYLVELSKGVLERCMVHIDNVYRFANADIYGRICNTHCASNTAFRFNMSIITLLRLFQRLWRSTRHVCYRNYYSTCGRRA